MSRSLPILLMSDAPCRHSGLGRITRDLATLVARMPAFRVATLGLGATGSRQLPFLQYSIQQMDQYAWGATTIERVWEDFARRERGVIMTIWDATRLHWFARPDSIKEADGGLHSFLTSGRFSRWGYFPIDSNGPSGKLTGEAQDTFLGYDRLLTYTKWAEGVLRATVSDGEASRRGLTWLPHGIDLDVFQPFDRLKSRIGLPLYVTDQDLLLGVNMTNQPRKDWGLTAAVCGLLRQQLPNVKFWWHTDLLTRHWSLRALVEDFGIADCVFVTTSLSDTQLAQHYSACDLTMLPSLGEGFGYPIFESLACGVPCIHGDYAGGADVLRQCGWDSLLVPPQAMHLETLWNAVRPVYDPNAWVARVHEVLDRRLEAESLRASVSHLSWANLGGVWQRWFEEGTNV